ncbi:MAG: hypothetical protein L0221_06730 [Chloroflexi bacterium]|nr:hypothetical protein [Chloroflexota bacterium]
MAILAYIAALLAFVLEVLDVSVFGQTGGDLIAAGLACVALGLLIGSITRAPGG